MFSFRVFTKQMKVKGANYLSWHAGASRQGQRTIAICTSLTRGRQSEVTRGVAEIGKYVARYHTAVCFYRKQPQPQTTDTR